MRSLLLLSLTMLLGCPVDKELGGDSGEGGDTDPVDPVGDCSEDVECASWQICESSECVDGDRNNATDEAEAVDLDSDTALNRYINNAGDVDYYTFESGGGEFIFAFTDAHDEVAEGAPVPDTFLTLYDPDGGIVTTADDFPNGGQVNNMDSALWGYLNQPGTYTIKVSDANPVKGNESWGGQNFSYSLEVKTWTQATYGSSTFAEPLFGDDGLTLEENTLYAVGVIIEEPGAVDYITVNFPHDNAGLYVDGTEDLSGSDMNPMASILTTDEVLLAQRDQVGPDAGVFYPNMTEGQYVIAVEDAEGGGGTNHWAVLIIKALNEGSALDMETEPNDTQVQATEISMTENTNSGGKVYFDGMVQGVMDAPGDVDMFKMEVSGEHTIEDDEGTEVQYLVLCMNSGRWGSSVAPDLAVYDGAGTELGSNSGDMDDNPNNNIENIALVPGEPVYVSVTAGEDSLGSPDEWYMLKAYIASFSVTSYEEGGYSCP